MRQRPKVEKCSRTFSMVGAKKEYVSEGFEAMLARVSALALPNPTANKDRPVALAAAAAAMAAASPPAAVCTPSVRTNITR